MRGARQIIGVVGHTGMVGAQVFGYYKKKGFKTFGLSKDRIPPKNNSTWDDINKDCNLIFVCVPTPFNFKTQKPDFSIVDHVINQITSDKIVIIKSTVWPGTTARLQKDHPKLRILFNPEFLSRKTANRDFERPDRQLLGYTNKSKAITQTVLRILPKGKYSRVMTATEAELIKYAHNVYGSMRIIYANHLFEICKKLKIDYPEVKNGFAASEFIGPGILRYMNVVHHDNKRGYGGPCFPKDVNNFLQFCKSIDVPAELAQATREANVRILRSQGLDEHKAEKIL